ncbi:MAG: helical backbone metal receptor [Chitinivibrionales bacterium]|nr:helical backbone metal receptor [Chitinivibrionales bacterium]
MNTLIKKWWYAGLIAFALPHCNNAPDHPAISQSGYHRIISLVPSITETLFALGAGDRVVGVSRFSSYPPQVVALPKVGGFTDPNYEFILRLKPDLVVGLKEQQAMRKFCEKTNIAFCQIDNHNLAAILESFAIIGAACGKSRQADSLINTITVLVKPSGADSARPVRLLVCAGRDNVGLKSIASIYAAGPRTFYADLVRAAKATNVITDSAFDYPQVSAEAIARLHPDIILDLLDPQCAVSEAVAEQDWRFLKKISGGDQTKIVALKRDYTTIPGPRVGLVLKDIKDIVLGYRTENK